MPEKFQPLKALLVVAVMAVSLAIIGLACGGESKKEYASPTPRGGTATVQASPSRGPAEAAAEIKMIPSIKFDKNMLTIAADKNVQVTADNTDTGVRHNFAVYRSKADADAGKTAIAQTTICAGPCKGTVTLNLTPGEYFFRCEVHRTQMTGTLTAK